MEPKSDSLPENEEIAGILDQIAELLEMQSEYPFRIQVKRESADSIRSFSDSTVPIAIEKSEPECWGYYKE